MVANGVFSAILSIEVITMRCKKRFFSMILSLCFAVVLLSGCDSTFSSPDSDDEKSSSKKPSSPVTVAQETDYSAMAEIPANGVQDLRYWSLGRIALKDPVLKMDDFNIYKYKISSDDVQAYVQMLQNHGFTLVDEHHQSSWTGKWESFGLLCDSAPDAKTIGLQYTGTPCHVSFWLGSGDWRMDVSEDLVVCDLGIRMDGSTYDPVPHGDSVGAGLIRQSDGTYVTSDNRLSTAVGHGTMLYNGTSVACNPKLELKNGTVTLSIDGYYPDESITLEYAEGSLRQGDIFRSYELESQNPSFAMICTDGQTYTLGPKGRIPFRSVSVRVMHYEEGRDAVFYIYADPISMDSEIPASPVEILCAINTVPYVEPAPTMPEISDNMQEIAGSVDATLHINVGESAKIGSTLYKFDSMYHVYDWQITLGNEQIDIYSVGSTCYVTGIEKGVAILTVEYGYTEKEPDVLTGIIRDARKIITITYTILVE